MAFFRAQWHEQLGLQEAADARKAEARTRRTALWSDSSSSGGNVVSENMK